MKTKQSALRVFMSVLLLIASAFLMLPSLSLSASALNDRGESENYYEEQAEASGAKGLYEGLSRETTELLGKLGISSVDFNEIFGASPRAVIKLIGELIRDGAEQPMRAGAIIVIALMLLAVGGSFMGDKKKISVALEVVGAVFIITCVAALLYDEIRAAVSAVELSSGFMLLLIPVVAGLITASGCPAQAVSYNAAAFLAAQSVSGITSKLVVPSAGAALSLGFADIFLPSFGLSSFADTLKKTSLWVMSSAAALFASFLSIKGVLARSADTLSAKGIKLVLSSAIPVVGSALSEAYSSIAGSISLLKSAAGAFGIIVVVLMNLPVVISLSLWIAVLKIAQGMAGMLSVKSIESLLKAISGALVILNVCVIFCAFVLVIATGTALNFGTHGA